MINRTLKEHMLIVANKTLSNRNKALEKRVHLLEKELMAKEIAAATNAWLDEPYQENLSEKEDIERFARKLAENMITKLQS